MPAADDETEEPVEPSASHRELDRDTAARLRAAARDAFAAGGWQGTRVQDVVTRAGVSHGTFYTYYANRAAILEALLDEVESGFLALAQRPWHGDDVHAALAEVIGGFLEHYRAHTPIIGAWLEAAREQPDFAERYRRARRMFVSRVAEQVQATAAASSRGRPPVTAGAVAATLVAMVEHVAWTWMTLGEPDDRDEALRSLVLVWGAALNELAGFEVVPSPGS